MKKWLSNNPVLILFSLCLISRLPQLLSPTLFLDGDECIIGLMAKHFVEGKELPYFFYGQSYGFAFVEILFISMFYAIAGISDMSVKLSMLLLWSIGIIFFYKTLRQIHPNGNKWTALLVTILFIFFPAWALWSMKARGGYLTAFALSTLITYLIFNKKMNTVGSLMLIGFLTVVIYQSQPLWLAGLIPIVGYYLYQLKRIGSVMQLCLGVAAAILLFNYLKSDLSNFWSPQILSFANLSFKSFLSIPTQIYQSLSGSYNYGEIVIPNITTQVLAFTATVFIFITLPVSLYWLRRGKKVNGLFYVFCVSVLGTISYPLIMNDGSPRYLLPLYGYTSFMLYQVIINLEKEVMFNRILYLAIILGSISIYSFKHHKIEEANQSDLMALIDKLEFSNTHHVFVNGGLLQWQIMFYSNERVIARYHSHVDRYPKYIEMVNDALKNEETKVSMVGFFDPGDTSISPHIIPIKNQYYIYENPDETVLKEYRFSFKKINNDE